MKESGELEEEEEFDYAGWYEEMKLRPEEVWGTKEKSGNQGVKENSGKVQEVEKEGRRQDGEVQQKASVLVIGRKRVQPMEEEAPSKKQREVEVEVKKQAVDEVRQESTPATSANKVSAVTAARRQKTVRFDAAPPPPPKPLSPPPIVAVPPLRATRRAPPAPVAIPSSEANKPEWWIPSPPVLSSPASLPFPSSLLPPLSPLPSPLPSLSSLSPQSLSLLRSRVLYECRLHRLYSFHSSERRRSAGYESHLQRQVERLAEKYFGREEIGQGKVGEWKGMELDLRKEYEMEVQMLQAINE